MSIVIFGVIAFLAFRCLITYLVAQDEKELKEKIEKRDKWVAEVMRGYDLRYESLIHYTPPVLTKIDPRNWSIEPLE